MAHNPQIREGKGVDLNCPFCDSINIRHRHGLPHYYCRRCGTTFNYTLRDGFSDIDYLSQSSKLDRGEQ